VELDNPVRAFRQRKGGGTMSPVLFDRAGRIAGTLLALLIIGAMPASAESRLDIALGAKSMDDDWEDITLIGRSPATQGFESGSDLADPVFLGLMFTHRPEGWPVGLAADLLISADEDDVTVVDFATAEIFEIDLEGNTVELDVGVRRAWSGDRILIFLGGGLAYVTAERREEDRQDITVSVEDDGFGAWAAAGVHWRVSRAWSVGIEGRVTRAEVKLLDQDVEAGGEHLAVVGGFAW
jgi:opacity protein-like surface antigen